MLHFKPNPVFTYLLVRHLEQLQRRLLQGTDGLADLLWIGFVLVGQNFPHLGDFLAQFVTLEVSKRNQ